MPSYLLRSYQANMNSPTPLDKEIILTEVVLDANGQAVLNLSHYNINPQSTIYWVALGTTQSYGKVQPGKFGTAQIDIKKNEIPISLTNVDANGDVPAVTVPTAGKTALIMLIIDPRDKIG